ncbi:MAG: hypothetical protein ACYCW6_29315, partial [Candidatus Xenobia bacterium]
MRILSSIKAWEKREMSAAPGSFSRHNAPPINRGKVVGAATAGAILGAGLGAGAGAIQGAIETDGVPVHHVDVTVQEPTYQNQTIGQIPANHDGPG